MAGNWPEMTQNFENFQILVKIHQNIPIFGGKFHKTVKKRQKLRKIQKKFFGIL